VLVLGLHSIEDAPPASGRCRRATNTTLQPGSARESRHNGGVDGSIGFLPAEGQFNGLGCHREALGVPAVADGRDAGNDRIPQFDLVEHSRVRALTAEFHSGVTAEDRGNDGARREDDRHRQ